MAVQKSGLSNIQLELLKLYANDIAENDLLAIRQLLARYFADKASDAMDQFSVDNNLSSQDMMVWANGHDRAENRH
jgi:hypothetical protein